MEKGEARGQRDIYVHHQRPISSDDEGSKQHQGNATTPTHPHAPSIHTSQRKRRRLGRFPNQQTNKKKRHMAELWKARCEMGKAKTKGTMTIADDGLYWQQDGYVFCLSLSLSPLTHPAIYPSIYVPVRPRSSRLLPMQDSAALSFHPPTHPPTVQRLNTQQAAGVERRESAHDQQTSSGYG